MLSRWLIGRQLGRLHRLDESRAARRLQELGRRCATGGERRDGTAERDRFYVHGRLLLYAATFIAAAAIIEAFSTAHASAPRMMSPVSSPPSAPVPTGAPVPVALVEAVAIGLRSNRAIRSAYLERVAQKFDLTVAESRFLPRLDIAASINVQEFGGESETSTRLSPSVSWLAPTGANVGFVWDRRTRDGVGGAASETTTLSVSQPLLRGGGFAVNRSPVRLARLQEEINRLRLEATVIDTVTTIILSYRSLVQAQEQVRLSMLARERTRDLLETNRALIAAGRMAAADIVQTESQLANQEVAVLQAEQAKISAQLALLQLLAVSPRTNIEAADAIDVEYISVDLEEAIDLALNSRTDVMAQTIALEQNKESLRVARNNRLWSLSVFGRVSRQDGFDAPFNPSASRTDSAAGLQLDIPIGDFSLRQGEIRARTQMRTGELRFDELRQFVEAQIRDAVQRVEASWLQVQAARQARLLTERALELEREKFSAGRASNFEVLSFEADLRNADTQQLNAEINYLNALTALDQQIGSTLRTWRIVLND